MPARQNPARLFVLYASLRDGQIQRFELFSNERMEGLRQRILRHSFVQPKPLAAQKPGDLSVALSKPAQAQESKVAAQWELSRIVAGHSGWIYSVAFDPENDFFATGSADQTIKIWSLQTGELRLTLTGHRMGVRAVAISAQLPYLFSAGEDKSVFCWDLEHNQIVRQFHGHRSGVYCAALHPSIPNILVTGSRDSTARVWDVRSRACIHVLQGHDAAINTVVVEDDFPQIITGSQDRTVRTWDLVSGKCTSALTQHNNSIRAIAVHPNEYTFVSGARDGLKQWKLPEGKLLGSYGDYKDDGVTMMALNEYEDALYAGYDSGVIRVFDYGTGHLVDELRSAPLPGSLESETAVLCGSFDVTRSRLVTGHMDKTVRLWKPRT